MTDGILEPEGTLTEAEKAQQNSDVLRQALNALSQRAKAEAVTELTQIIGTIGTAKPEPTPARVETGKPEAIRAKVGLEIDRAKFYFGEINDARDYQYRRFDPEMRRWRNPVNDQLVARWFRALVKQDTATLAEIELMQRAVISDGTITATSGLAQGTAGSLIPLPLANSIVLTRDKEAVMRSICSVFMSESNTLRIPKLGSATVAQVAEGSTASVGEPASTSVLLTKKKTQFRGQFSEEALQDSAFNLVSILSERGGSAFAQNEDVQAFTSAGTGANWTGSVETPNADSAGAQAVTEVAEASSTVLTYEDVVKLYFTGTTKPYRSRCVWFGNATMMQFLSTIEDAQGRTVFQPMMSTPLVVGDYPGQQGTIFGRPVYEVPLSNGNLYFMDPKRYGILEGGTMAMKTTDAASWTSDYIDFKVTVRMDGALLDNDAFARISGITSVA